MSNIEIFIIVSLCLIPIIALVILLPKIIKNRKLKSSIPEPKNITPTIEEKIEPVISEKPIEENVYSSDDFKSYLDEKRQKISRPTKRESLPDFDFEDFDKYKRRQNRHIQSTSKTIADQFNELSPEMRALIISGALNKKNYEEY